MTPAARPRILFVDDEPELLAGVVRSLRTANYDITSTTSGTAAIDILTQAEPFAAIVSDLNMPGINGIALLKTAREIAPDMVRVLFTGQADLDAAIAAVNDGAVFRFITKPCSRVSLALTLKAAIEHHQLITAERVLLAETLRGSIRAMTDILGLVAPLAFGRASRLRTNVVGLLAAMDIRETWHIEVATMLSQIGRVILPPHVLERIYHGEAPTESERAMLRTVPQVNLQFLNGIPRLEPVLDILRHNMRRFDGAGAAPGAPRGEDIPFGARVLRIVDDHDRYESQGLTPDQALDELYARPGYYDPIVLEAFVRFTRTRTLEDGCPIQIASLQPGMVVVKDLRTNDGQLCVAHGQTVTPGLLEKLRNFAGTLHLDGGETVLVRERDAAALK